MSEFVVYMFKKNLDPRKLSRYSLSSDTTSPSNDDVLPDANTPKSKLRASPLNLSTPRVKVEKQEGNVTDNFRARPVALDPNKFKKQMAATQSHAELPDNSFNGAIFFHVQMSEASTGHFGNPHFSHLVRISSLSLQPSLYHPWQIGWNSVDTVEHRVN